MSLCILGCAFSAKRLAWSSLAPFSKARLRSQLRAYSTYCLIFERLQIDKRQDKCKNRNFEKHLNFKGTDISLFGFPQISETLGADVPSKGFLEQDLSPQIMSFPQNLAPRMPFYRSTIVLAPFNFGKELVAWEKDSRNLKKARTFRAQTLSNLAYLLRRTSVSVRLIRIQHLDPTYLVKKGGQGG